MREAKLEKRNRPPKSCEPCRNRKLKCNRGLPCDTCIRRGKSALCQYASNADRNDRHENKPESMTERLKTLEDLITSLAQKSQSKPPDTIMTLAKNRSRTDAAMTTDSDAGSDAHVRPKDEVETLGGGLLSGLQASYTDSSHWSSILEDIKDIREQLSSSFPQERTSTATASLTDATEVSLEDESQHETDLFLGCTVPLDLQQVLRSLPSRRICDSLVSCYFRSQYTILPILHPIKFQREYESFWETPNETSTVWIGLLFSVLSLAAMLFEFSDTSRSSEHPPANALSKSAEQCLVLGKYSTTNEHSLEALIIHLQGCFLRSNDSDVNLWFQAGAIIRLAILKGYHRDADKLPGSPLSPFAGEMRRRIWISIFQIDALMSFQMGLPSMIPSEYCDTSLPRNLEYSDFSPETAVLPPSRPSSDCTPILYTIVKASAMTMFKKVVSHTRSLVRPSYEQAMVLDEQVRDVYNNMPENYKHKPLRQSIFDNPGIIMNRITIEMVYLKSIIVLHRHHITIRDDLQSEFPKRACLEAAGRVLDRQAELYEVTQPGGQLYDVRWMVSALTTNDFILAAMVICLDLTMNLRRLGERGFSASKESDDGFQRYFAAIKASHGVWMAASEYSSEARIAAHALQSTMQRINDHRDAYYGSLTSQFSQVSPYSENPPRHVESSSAEYPPAMVIETDFIDWGLLDNYSHDRFGEDLDLDSWVLDIVGPAGAGNCGQQS
ncbi:fungal-specific transcription factor domain-containing protein [Dactylonectria estremocensis]|uniref:Fungal-specific transcription factor domain-containing protein n=1 Tax=Dactylonectria estremocensis TaxID=1079267 RepID=A0A9P9F4H9_9HYPO|nr:fungal-specific transcription factor domain-containing protein [Dactylonectria estremocensis]